MSDLNRCSTCGNPIQEAEPVVRVENKYRRTSVQYFHADYRGCAAAEDRTRPSDRLSGETISALDAI